jgi:hypothetical protein
MTHRSQPGIRHPRLSGQGATEARLVVHGRAHALGVSDYRVAGHQANDDEKALIRLARAIAVYRALCQRNVGLGPYRSCRAVESEQSGS